MNKKELLLLEPGAKVFHNGKQYTFLNREIFANKPLEFNFTIEEIGVITQDHAEAWGLTERDPILDNPVYQNHYRSLLFSANRGSVWRYNSEERTPESIADYWARYRLINLGPDCEKYKGMNYMDPNNIIHLMLKEQGFQIP